MTPFQQGLIQGAMYGFALIGTIHMLKAVLG